MNRLTHAFFGISALLLNAFPLHALADEEGGTPEPGTLGAAIPETQLASNRGGHTLELNTNNLDAQLYENQAIANVTGNNFITNGAFSGANGMPTVIQNSGNNVLIQNATILNLKLQ
jgi:hypothetical protein